MYRLFYAVYYSIYRIANHVRYSSDLLCLLKAGPIRKSVRTLVLSDTAARSFSTLVKQTESNKRKKKLVREGSRRCCIRTRSKKKKNGVGRRKKSI